MNIFDKGFASEKPKGSNREEGFASEKPRSTSSTTEISDSNDSRK
jgi:hypothetical protein